MPDKIEVVPVELSENWDETRQRPMCTTPPKNRLLTWLFPKLVIREKVASPPSPASLSRLSSKQQQSCENEVRVGGRGTGEVSVEMQH